MSLRIVAAAVLVAGYFGVAAYGRLAETIAQRERDAIVSAVDDLWSEALFLGADRERWPEVEFAAEMDDLAVTVCSRPRPTIRLNDRRLSEYRWYIHNLTIPHEMAHVMVCLEGDVDGWREQHGEAWAHWVRMLVPRDRAEEVLAEQRALDQPGVAGASE